VDVEHGDGGAAVRRAPRGRRSLAGTVDGAFVAGAAWLTLRRRGRGEGAVQGRMPRATRAASEALAQQLVTPGQLLAGVRTVDRRTGARLALWRSLASVAVAGAADVAARTLVGAETSVAPDADDVADIARIRAQHAGDPDAPGAALAESHRAHEARIDTRRAIAVPVALAVVERRLRRRIAPTVVVRRSRRPRG
jgi:hypothetical protein